MRLTQLARGDVPDGQFVVPADDELLAVRREGQGVEMTGNGYVAGGGGGFHRTRSSLTRSAFGSIPASSFAPCLIHAAMTVDLLLRAPRRPVVLAGRHPPLVLRRDQADAGRSRRACRATIGSPSVPPAMSFSNVVMSYLPDLLLGVVAGEAVLLEDRGHVVDEADRLALSIRGRSMTED